jgi:hypothetical protein
MRTDTDGVSLYSCLLGATHVPAFGRLDAVSDPTVLAAEPLGMQLPTSRSAEILACDGNHLHISDLREPRSGLALIALVPRPCRQR